MVVSKRSSLSLVLSSRTPGGGEGLEEEGEKQVLTPSLAHKAQNLFFLKISTNFSTRLRSIDILGAEKCFNFSPYYFTVVITLT